MYQLECLLLLYIYVLFLLVRGPIALTSELLCWSKVTSFSFMARHSDSQKDAKERVMPPTIEWASSKE